VTWRLHRDTGSSEHPAPHRRGAAGVQGLGQVRSSSPRSRRTPT
jgi:hypothetical protein